ncbi:hypothetical protein DL546_006758, partial [Coniochaeta pulveracea]
MKLPVLTSLLTLLPDPATTWSLVHCSARSYCTYLDRHAIFCRTPTHRDTHCHSMDRDHDGYQHDGARSYHVRDWGNCTSVSFYWNNNCTHQWHNYTQKTLTGCKMMTYPLRSFRFDCPGGADGAGDGSFLAEITCKEGEK